MSEITQKIALMKDQFLRPQSHNPINFVCLAFSPFLTTILQTTNSNFMIIALTDFDLDSFVLGIFLIGVQVFQFIWTIIVAHLIDWKPFSNWNIGRRAQWYIISLCFVLIGALMNLLSQVESFPTGVGLILLLTGYVIKILGITIISLSYLAQFIHRYRKITERAIIIVLMQGFNIFASLIYLLFMPFFISSNY